MTSAPLLSAAAMAMAVAVTTSLAVALLLCTPAAAVKQPPPLAQGLSFDFYKRSCPKAESIVKEFLTKAIREDVGLAAGLIRLHFHDCFVQGCDASVLLDGSATGPGEQQAPPNLTLRPAAFKAINAIRDRLHKECRGAVVSCSDILAVAARDSVVLSGGPSYRVPLGRRDSPRFATAQDVLAGLPPPSSTVPALLAVLRRINLDNADLVALSGGHTVGVAHCASFEDRLFPTQDAAMDKWFAGHLRLTCPRKGVDNTTVNDIRTPNTFDNKYYVDLLNRQGLFTSDQDLFTDAATKPIVARFAQSQDAFFKQFAASVVKMGQINVLTGDQGQVRRNCSARNPGTIGGGDDGDELPWSAVEAVVEAAESLVLQV